METCYRHPSRQTGVSCSSCGRPICPDCMTPTPVGMRCPECARQRTRVRNMPSVTRGGEPTVTFVLLALNVIAFLGEGRFGVGSQSGGSTLFDRFALYGPKISHDHEYWRLITSGFLHAGLLHIFFNMYLLYLLGQMLEPAIGSVRFALLYFGALLAGSFGALLATPDTFTVGASGAVFGLMGAAAVEMRARGIDPFQTGIGGLIVFNLVLSFVLNGISIGGHIGGLIGGALIGLLYTEVDRGRLPRQAAIAGSVLVAVVAAAGGIAVAGGSGISG
jgi:membrane associated rhomboid family serine protease